MKALVIVNGDLPSELFLADIIKKFDYVAATDGAAARLPTTLKLDLICGDFDSISQVEAAQRFPQAQVMLAADQNNSDLEKTLGLVREHGARSITLVGSLGGRIDHSLVSLSALIGLHEKLALSLIDEESELILLSPFCIRNGTIKFAAENDEIVSLIPLAPFAMVSIAGVRWPLTNHKLMAGSGGVSNRGLGGEVTVSVSEGCVGLTRSFAIDRIR